MKKRILSAVCVLLLAALIIAPGFALAESDVDTAGNVMFDTSFQGETAPLDIFGFGETVNVSDSSVGASAILAGKNLSVSNSTVNGSLRAAGYNVIVSSTNIAANATVAGYSIQLGGGFDAKGVYVAGSTISFSGKCTALYAAASTVTLNGTVNGDAKINAERVVIGSTAVVTGTLYVESGAEPVVPAGAAINNLSFEQTQSAEEASAAVNAVSPLVKVLNSVKSLLLFIPGRILLAVLYFFVIGGTVKKAGDMLTTRTAPMLLSGLIGLLALPIAAVVLLLTYIGIPVSVLLMLLLGLSMGFSISFTACALAPRVFPKMHPLVASIIGVTVFSIVGIIPILKGILSFACILFTLGYFIQTVYLGWQKKAPAPEAQTEAL